MLETRIDRIEHYAQSEGNEKILLGVEEIPREVSDEELLIKQIEAETTEANDLALWAHTNFDSLTDSQRKKVLKGLLGDFISRNKSNYM